SAWRINRPSAQSGGLCDVVRVDDRHLPGPPHAPGADLDGDRTLDPGSLAHPGPKSDRDSADDDAGGAEPGATGGAVLHPGWKLVLGPGLEPPHLGLRPGGGRAYSRRARPW